MISKTLTNQNLERNPQMLTMKERNYWCNRLQCSLKDLVIAEYEVGIDPGDIIDYFKNNDVL